MSNLKELNYAIISELRDQLEAKEQMIKELKLRIKSAEGCLMTISYETSAVGGNKKDMKQALLNISEFCRECIGENEDDTN